MMSTTRVAIATMSSNAVSTIRIVSLMHLSFHPHVKGVQHYSFIKQSMIKCNDVLQCQAMLLKVLTNITLHGIKLTKNIFVADSVLAKKLNEWLSKDIFSRVFATQKQITRPFTSGQYSRSLRVPGCRQSTLKASCHF